MYGKTLDEAREDIQNIIEGNKQELDVLTSKIVESGLGFQTEVSGDFLIVQGTSNILKNGTDQDLESIQRLFNILEQQETATKLLEEAAHGQGVQIFIGAENTIFQGSALSMVISPYKDEKNRVIGATGVIGPTRLNYRKVIPMVEYTSSLITKLMDR